MNLESKSFNTESVCPAADAKKRRQRRYRLRKQWKASGLAPLHTCCRECGVAIKPSYHRGFCAKSTGRDCREKFFQNVQVQRVVPIYRGDAALSESVLHPPESELVPALLSLFGGRPA
ncbi:MAG: hypothetical protein ACRD3Q_07845 [Terriglobales bacterium]